MTTNRDIFLNTRSLVEIADLYCATIGCERCAVITDEFNRPGCRSLLDRWLESDIECDEPDADDAVNHPAHYTAGDVECIDAIEAALGSGFVDYCIGAVIKYVWRWRLKGGVEDLRKARWYIERAIASEAGDSDECRAC